jgi:hypothetical protein
LHFEWLGSKKNHVAMRMAVFEGVEKGVKRKKLRGRSIRGNTYVEGCSQEGERREER